MERQPERDIDEIRDRLRDVLAEALDLVQALPAAGRAELKGDLRTALMDLRRAIADTEAALEDLG